MNEWMTRFSDVFRECRKTLVKWTGWKRIAAITESNDKLKVKYENMRLMLWTCVKLTINTPNAIEVILVSLLLIKTSPTLTNFSPVLYFIYKPVIWFTEQFKWLVSIWNGTMGWHWLDLIFILECWPIIALCNFIFNSFREF